MIPTPRSFQSILGSMIDTFRARTKVKSLRVGGPILSFLEAAAQSDTKATQDHFGLLNARSLDRATGPLLDLLGEEEAVYRTPAMEASGIISITDDSVDKVTTIIYTGRDAPVAGAFVVAVASTAGFAVGDRIYLGRGTSNYEGPLTISGIDTTPGSYGYLYLTAPITRTHLTGEVVTRGAGGDRVIYTGSTAMTGGSNPVTFVTTRRAVIPDGEVSTTVPVTCTSAGVIGNVGRGAISKMEGSFTVTNPLPFTNGAETEEDGPYRERIRLKRAARGGGTATAIRYAALGVKSTAESKRVTSASVVSVGTVTSLYIDDGTGYEETTASVPVEVLCDYAIGGEYLFRLANSPVAVPFVESTIPSPWAIPAGTALHVRVNDEVYDADTEENGVIHKKGDPKYHQHTFNDSDFVSSSAASAYEVVSSINGNYLLPFQARSVNGGSGIALYCKDGHSIQVKPEGTFGFSNSTVPEIKLYRNDKLLGSDEYLFNRDNGTIRLTVPLDPGDGLTVGTSVTTAYLETVPFENGTVTFAADAHVFLAAGEATLKTVPLTDETVTIQKFEDPVMKGYAYHINTRRSGYLLNNIDPNDWAVIVDDAFKNKWAYQIVDVDDDGSESKRFVIAPPVGPDADQLDRPLTLYGPLLFATSTVPVQMVTVPAATYDLPTLAALINDQLQGIVVEPWNNESLLFRTVTYGGTITFLAADAEGSRLGLGGSATGTDTNTAYKSSGSLDTPTFKHFVQPSLTRDTIAAELDPNGIVATSHAYGNEALKTTVKSTAPVTTIRTTPWMNLIQPDSHFYCLAPYAVGPADTLDVAVDGSIITVPMGRSLITAGPYSSTVTVQDPALLRDLDVTDFAVYMHARGVSGEGSILWRSARVGPGNVRLTIDYPVRVGSFDHTVDVSDSYANVTVTLPGEAVPVTIQDKGRFSFNCIDYWRGRARIKIKYATVALNGMSRSNGTVTVNLQSAHRLNGGDIVWITTNHAGFPSGPKIVTKTTGTGGAVNDFSYAEPGLDISYVSVTGSIRYSASPPDFGSVNVGDVIYIDPSIGVKIGTVSIGGSYEVVLKEEDGGLLFSAFKRDGWWGDDLNQNIHTFKVTADSIKFFRVPPTTNDELVSYVNSNMGSIVTATTLKTGTVTTTKADYLKVSMVEGTAPYVPLVDGINWVDTYDPAGTVKFKVPVASTLEGLTGPEELIFCPITAPAIARYLSSRAVSGLYQVATVTGEGTVQIASNGAGGEGTVAVVGGTANGVAVPVVGLGEVVGNGSVVMVDSTGTVGLTEGSYVTLTGSVPGPIRTLAGTDATSLTFGPIEGSTCKITVAGANLWNFAAPISTYFFSVTPQGRYAMYRQTGGTFDTSAMKEGDWLETTTFNPIVYKQFRVVRVDSPNKCLWVEDPDAVNESKAALVLALTHDSAVIGSRLVIGTGQNRGSWEIVEYGETNEVTITWPEGSTPPKSGTVNLTDPATGTGNESLKQLISITEGSPIRLTKRIRSIIDGPGDTSYVTFDTSNCIEYVSVHRGVTLEASNKLSFDSALRRGLDGYSYSTGLIGEVARVIYGDERDPELYPGVAAAGHTVSISGPALKRITVALLLRLVPGADPINTVTAVKNAIAAKINSYGVGNSIAISDIIAVASAVPGVLSVTMIRPAYGIGEDLIAVQSYEKPLIVDIESDIAIEIMGQ